jgi:SAM-dependent methyltransferase
MLPAGHQTLRAEVEFGMNEDVRNCYDQLAANYHLVYADWNASIVRQAAAIDVILNREFNCKSLRILDCACGIGTQAIGLAEKGYKVAGCDLSLAAIERARSESAARGLHPSFFVADMLDLTSVPEQEFDCVMCLDNALPHLQTEKELAQAAKQIRSKLRTGGMLMTSIRDYDGDLAGERPVVKGPLFYTDAAGRRIVHQVWDWIDDRRYTFHLYITREIAGRWESHHYTSVYRAVLRDELTSIVEAAGFASSNWMRPSDSGFYQPLLVAKST